jgi:pimeloyl-ACP methyl ester carboxylesterase
MGRVKACGSLVNRERHRFRARWLGALQHATIPLCLIDGVQDPISGADIVRRWRELLPGHRAVELNAIGHYPQWESPARVLTEAQEFFLELTYPAVNTAVSPTGRLRKRPALPADDLA